MKDDRAKMVPFPQHLVPRETEEKFVFFFLFLRGNGLNASRCDQCGGLGCFGRIRVFSPERMYLDPGLALTHRPKIAVKSIY